MRFAHPIIVCIFACNSPAASDVVPGRLARAASVAISPSSLNHDLPAAEAFELVDAAFKANEQASLKLKLFELDDPFLRPIKDIVMERAEKLGLDKSKIDLNAGYSFVRATDGTSELLVNKYSGSERYLISDLFHALPGVNQELVDDDRYYIDQGLIYIDRQLGAHPLKSAIYPYKLRHYLNGWLNDKDLEEEEVYQVSVAYTHTLDGWPVIGSGGKFVVHMSVSGDVISHESYLGSIGKETLLKAAYLVPPEKALKRVETRLRADDVLFDKYVVTRKEFGYLRLSRSSHQRLVLPYYAFFLDPVTDTEQSGGLIEIEPATEDSSVLARLAADLAIEAQRKKDIRSLDP